MHYVQVRFCRVVTFHLVHSKISMNIIISYSHPLYHRGIPVNVGLHGTPGDYAWGPQGLDNIITQLLATFEDNGPPPADTKKVEELPFVQATEEDLKPCE